jgi:hypothetical protein
MSDITTTSSKFVSPFVTSYTPGAYINIDSTVTEEVEVTGVQEIFAINLTDPTKVAKFLGGFNVSGVSVDTRLGKTDMNMSNFDVSMGGIDFQAELMDIIANASNGDKKIDEYLYDELYSAFTTAFAGKLPSSTISGNNNAAAGSSGTVAEQPGSSNPAADAAGAFSSATSGLTTLINSFDVHVDMDASAAAFKLIDDHSEQNNHLALKSLFRQIPRTTWSQYVPAEEHEALDLCTNSLPLLFGDKLVFVFDIDVKAAGSNSSGETGQAAGGDEIPASTEAENVPTAGTQSDAYGTASFSLNLANRRVAFEITLSPSDKASGDKISPVA